MIVCPETGIPADTGCEVTSIPHLVGIQWLVDCLECGQDHTWQLEDTIPE